MPTEEDFQVRMQVDQFRTNEILFDPSIIGVENAGISECLEIISKHVSDKEKRKLLQYVFLTGGNTKIKGFS